MPIYEYRCSRCGFVFERLRSIGDRDEVAVCDRCGSISGRLLSAIAHGHVWAWVPHPEGCSHEPIKENDEERLETQYQKMLKATGIK